MMTEHTVAAVAFDSGKSAHELKVTNMPTTCHLYTQCTLCMHHHHNHCKQHPKSDLLQEKQGARHRLCTLQHPVLDIPIYHIL